MCYLIYLLCPSLNNTHCKEDIGKNSRLNPAPAVAILGRHHEQSGRQSFGMSLLWHVLFSEEAVEECASEDLAAPAALPMVDWKFMGMGGDLRLVELHDHNIWDDQQWV